MSENGESWVLLWAMVLGMSAKSANQDTLYYQAMLARDYRFDGKFFVGVRTTGIYCRPICPAKPKRENVEFFTTSNLAERAGYRPCLRCRPESAPLSPAWHGKSAVVQRALKAIAANQLNELNEERFAEQFGMTARHLRRLFEEEIGQTPKQIANGNRLGFARKLVVETQMPMTQVSEIAGFQSLRRFNDAFRKKFTKAPTELRRSKKASKAQGGVSEDLGINLLLSFRPPYDWQTLLNFFESHRISSIEAVREGGFERVFTVDGELGWFRIEPPSDKSAHALRLRVIVGNPKILLSVVTRVRRMFDLDSDPLLIANQFSQAKLLSDLHKKFPGLRLPRGWDGYESAVCSILGQLVSVEQARKLVGQLVEHYGVEAKHLVTGEKVKLFPTSAVLAKAGLSEVKTTEARKASIRELSQKVLTGEISLSDAQDPARFREVLLAIRGIGPWSAEYISLRAIGDTDAFPGTDLILKRATELYPDLDLEAVRPWRSYAAIYLWKEFAKTLSRTKKTKGKIKK